MADRSEAISHKTGSNLNRKVAYLLFSMCWISFIFFNHGGGWGQNANIDLTRAIVENGSFIITEYVQNTGDWAKVEENYYINKNPGVSFFAVPAYFIIHLIAPNAFDSFIGAQAAFHLTIVFSIAIYAALAIAFFYLWLVRFVAPFPAFCASLICAIGTHGFAYNSMLSAQSLVASSYMLGLYLMWRAADFEKDSQPAIKRMHLAGFIMGIAVLAEPTALFGLFIFFAILVHFRFGYKTWIALIAGGVPCAALLFIYNINAFGSPLSTAYLHQNPFFLQSDAFLGVFGPPSIKVLYYILLDPLKGLAWVSPVMLLAPAGLFFLLRRKNTRFIAALFCAMIGFYILFNISFITWKSGWGSGPRYLIPSMPFWAASLAFVFSGPKVLRIFGYCLGSVSLFLQLVITGVNPQIPEFMKMTNPLTQYVWPLFKAGGISVNTQSILQFFPKSITKVTCFEDAWASYNLGELAGLQGPVSLAILLCVWILGISIAYRITASK